MDDNTVEDRHEILELEEEGDGEGLPLVLVRPRSNDVDHISTQKGMLISSRTWKRYSLPILGLSIGCFGLLVSLMFLSRGTWWLGAQISDNTRSAEEEFNDHTTHSTLPINYTPSLHNPFIFFHQRKSGGSTLRSQLFRAANATNSTSFIPCLTKLGNPPIYTLDCQTYVTPESSSCNPIPTIYGGHLYYSFFLQTMYLLHNQPHGVAQLEPSTNKNFTCLTVYREPIDRIQSCWNFRMVQTSKDPTHSMTKLASVSPRNMDNYLTNARSQYGEGCLNEPMRVFSDYGDNEAIVNSLHLQPTAIREHATQQTIERSTDCIVGVLERCNDTKIAIERHLPFLAPYFSCDEHLNTGRVAKQELSAQQITVLQELAKYEQQAYDKANQRLDELIA